MATHVSRLGLFGGSFNPPHNGHVAAAHRAVQALGLDTLVVMPAGSPPHKELPPDAPAPAHRLTMARWAFEGIADCRVSDWEMNRPQPTYTVDTLEYLRADGLSLTLVVGSDMFLTLQEWVRVNEIFAAARVAVLLRNPADATRVSRHAAFLAHRYGASVEFVEHVPVVVSSTRLREQLRSGGGAEFLPEAVYDHITANGLYGVQT